MDADLLDDMNMELEALYQQADYMGCWPPHFDKIECDIRDKYERIQNERVDEVLLG